MKKLTRIFLFVMLFLMVFAPVVSASVPYSTYTYSINQEILESPHAYIPDVRVDSEYIDPGLVNLEDTPINTPKDVESDSNGNVYITDSGNERIIVTDKYYKLKYVLKNFVNSHGVDDSFKLVTSTFVWENKLDDGTVVSELFVCDSGNKRILIFDSETGAFKRELIKPETELLSSGSDFIPVSCAADKHGRIYVVSSATTEGIIVLTAEGKFINFIGAPKVTVTALEALIRKISSKEVEILPTTYTSVDIDYESQEFLYATIQYVDEEELANQLQQLTLKLTDFSPVKLLNAQGTDIMLRNGFFAPAGEVVDELESLDAIGKSDALDDGVSSVIDITSGPNGIWSIIDSKRSKVYTYDKDGNLLFIFGNVGDQLGNIKTAQSITYQNVGDQNSFNIIVLDSTGKSFTVYRPTVYAETLNEAIYYQNQRDYDTAVDKWEEVLKRNANFDTAYVAIGKSLYRSGKYEESIEYFKNAQDTENYAIAYKEVRSQSMEKLFIPMIILIVVAVILIGKVFKYAAKVNTAAQLRVGKKSLKEELLFGFHLMFHPFDGYWDLKHEQRGSARSATIYVIITIIAFYYQSIGKGYYSNPSGSYSTIFSAMSSVLIILFLWVIANWCLTTLFDGEGSLKDIYISTSYALFPLPFLIIVSTLLTNVLVGDEVQIVTMILAVGYIWVGLLLVLGMQVTHDYSMGKNIVTVIATIVGMIFIMFMALLFITLITKVVGFGSSIATELSYR
ncbi:MAG: YIP1 family protein [Clostridia bacterium]|nr:YIP1 family protein [Clostridia bacterium]